MVVLQACRQGKEDSKHTQHESCAGEMKPTVMPVTVTWNSAGNDKA